MRTPNPAIAQTHCWALGGQSTEMFLMSPCRQSNVYCRAESLSQLKSRSNWPSSAPQVSVGKSTVIVAEPKWSPRVAPCPRAPNNFIFLLVDCAKPKCCPRAEFIFEQRHVARWLIVLICFCEFDFSDFLFKYRKNFALRAVHCQTWGVLSVVELSRSRMVKLCCQSI